MRTKTLLVAGAIAVLGTVASYAQVYSQNTVGFYTVNLRAGFNLIANQFNGNPDNGLNTVIPASAPVPADASLVLWDKALQTFTAADTFYPTFGWYDPDFVPSTKVLNPGEGCFIQMPVGTSAALVMVGDVPEGDLDLGLQEGFQIVSQLTPQLLGFNASGFPAGENDTILFWDSATQTYPPARVLSYYSGAGVWADGDFNVVDPTPAIGEAVFYQRAVGNGTATWQRTFDVSP